MPRAIMKNGKIQPVDPLPSEWKEGQELVVHAQGSDDFDNPEEPNQGELDRWFKELNEMVSQNDPEDLKKVEEVLAENDRIEKERRRIALGL